MLIESPDFVNEEILPSKLTCDGSGDLPRLTIKGVPANAESLVLIVDDPDAPMGTFTHITMWNISPKITLIDQKHISETAVVGLNSANENGYQPPCPPYGLHRYFFKLFALDTALNNLNENTTAKDLFIAMQGHVLEKTELIGKYQRK